MPLKTKRPRMRRRCGTQQEAVSQRRLRALVFILNNHLIGLSHFLLLWAMGCRRKKKILNGADAPGVYSANLLESGCTLNS